MSKAFLDPEKPLTTCVAEQCDDCPVRERLHCHFQGRDLAHFLLVVAPSFVLGGAGIVLVQPWYLVPWLAIAVGYFGLLEIRVMCSHCPHYAEPVSSLKCWANYGSPKLWTYRPGPMSVTETVLFFGGLAAIWGYPLVFLLIGAQWFLLAVYALASAGFFMMLRTYQCSQCMNFACPLNVVDASTRRAFFACNPSIARAWGMEIIE
jgi:hypothetical protein